MRITYTSRAMPKQDISDFLRGCAGLFDEVQGHGFGNYVRDHRATRNDDRWWEWFDLDVEPKTRGALDLAWKAWQARNHPDKRKCSEGRFKQTKALYLRMRETLPERAEAG